MKPRFDRYYRYEELTALLHQYAAEYPHLLTLDSLGNSYEGRHLWLLTITVKATGEAKDKPALWVDGNIHATEIAPSSACLYFLHTLVTEYGQDPDITRCLETRAFYLCPRVNPDGAEWALADSPKFIRSGTRPYPNRETPPQGLTPEDIDGDGRILTMRIPDANGAWKPYPDDPRLMIPRDPTETGGTYYRLFPEGYIANYDGVLINLATPQEGLDFNRNFPFLWRPEGEQTGAGDYPTSEPEVRALTAFVTTHPNITGIITFHTMGGLLLRPYSHQRDEEMPPQDLQVYQKIGDKGQSLTDYQAMSIYHHYRNNAQDYVTGAFDDWGYEQRGVFAWTVELWSPLQQVGIWDHHPIHWYQDHPIEDDLALLQWSDEVLDGQGYVDWYPVEHPQLGKVELGGWNSFYAWRNPPPSLLEQEISPFPRWLVWHLLISPQLEIYETHWDWMGDGLYLVRLVVQNTGWLPTYVTQKAREKQVSRGCSCSITLPEGASLEMGEEQEWVGELEGRAYQSATPTRSVGDGMGDRAKVQWLIRAPNGGKVGLEARCDRAGVVRTTVELKE
ncbi:M14 family metallopeptidase [Spirulina sp. CS-785/01]|uniref:M14 family metallopeptidase n=1 Tax=Spirulina sp. CS-785/01 TaxID=3021716 RepID=UPI0023314395|nr:M14 family metallopeptidase [Spirulina sp. CS-785/01]MDB9314064.1 M14 family metallopeptidase [Spirulina sp. CS-785/01]